MSNKKKKNNPNKEEPVEIKVSDTETEKKKGTGPIFGTYEEFKNWVINSYVATYDTEYIEREFHDQQNLRPEDEDIWNERFTQYNDIINDYVREKTEAFMKDNPGAVRNAEEFSNCDLDDIEVPYGKKVTEMDDELVKDFLSYNMLKDNDDFIAECLRRDDPEYWVQDFDRKSEPGRAVEVFKMYKEIRNEFFEDPDGFEKRVIANHNKLILEGKIHDDFLNGNTFTPTSAKEEELLSDWFPEPDPTLDEPDTEPVDNSKNVEPHEVTAELVPETRDTYIKMAQDEYSSVSANDLGVNGKSINEDYNMFIDELEKAYKNKDIQPVTQERIQSMFRKISNDGEKFVHLTGEQLKGLFYLSKHARWFHRAVQNNPYKKDILADGYTDKDGNVTRKDKGSVYDMEKLRNARFSISIELQNKLAVAVDNLHPKLLEMAKTLSKEELAYLSIIFKVAGLDLSDLASPEKFEPSIAELLISELYEVLDNMDEAILPEVKVAKDVVFYLDKCITEKPQGMNVLELIFKTLVDLAFVGLINSDMTEYSYISTYLSLAIEYFECHPLYKFYDDVSGQYCTVNMLDRIHAVQGTKINPLNTETIDVLGEQIVNAKMINNNLKGDMNNMVRMEADNSEQAVNGLKTNLGMNNTNNDAEALQKALHPDNPWAPKETITSKIINGQLGGNPNGTPNPGFKIINNDGSSGFNLFPQEKKDPWKSVLQGDRSQLPVVGTPQYQAQPINGVVNNMSQPPVAIMNDPNIDKDYSIGTQHLWGLPDFQCTEKFYYINPTEVAVKYADGRVFIINTLWLPLMQEIWSMKRKAIMDNITRNGGYPRTTQFGTTDNLDIGLWNNFPSHIRYKVSTAHDNVYRAELVNNNNMNNNNLGGMNMNTISGTQGFMNGTNGMNGMNMNAAGTSMYTTAAQVLAGLQTPMAAAAANIPSTMPGFNTVPSGPGPMPNVYGQILGADQNGIIGSNNALVAQLQAQVAMLQQQVQALQAQIQAMNMRNNNTVGNNVWNTTPQTPMMNAGYNPMMQPNMTMPNMNTGISMYTANAMSNPLNNGPVQVVPNAANNVWNTQPNNMMPNAMNNQFNTGMPNMMMPNTMANNPFMNNNMMNTMPAYNNGFNLSNIPQMAPVNNQAAPGMYIPQNQPMNNNTWGMNIPAANQFATTVNFPGMFNTASNMTGGTTSGGYQYGAGLQQNPFDLMAQNVNTQFGTWLNPMMSNPNQGSVASSIVKKLNYGA